jgi:hypothetical protein
MIDATLALPARARKLPSMGRAVTLFTLATLFGRCDMAGTATTATANRVREQIGAAYQRAADRRQAQEKDGR